MTIARAQNPKPSEDGFILIEVLVSALILAIVAAAVLAVLSATTHSAASERFLSQAAGLAQEDQARLRTMRLTKLNGLDETREELTLDGTEYAVKSQGTFVNAAKNEVTCDGSSSVSDYIRVTSEVSSGALRNPYVMRSIVSPSNGSLDPNHGTISIRVANAKEQPVSGVSFSGKGAVDFQGLTDSTGCANFTDLPEGNYKVTASANGMITPKGESSTTIEYSAPRASTKTYTQAWDVPGAVEPSFQYRVGSGGTFVAGHADAIVVANSESGGGAKVFGTPGGTRLSAVNAPNLYPFKLKTSVYAGSCEANNPAKAPGGEAGVASVEIPRGGVAKPVITLPALNLNLTYGTAPVSGARVTTTTSSSCKYASKSTKRLYSTEANGHLATTSGEPDAGMPYGEYTVCASATIENKQRMRTATVTVNNWTTGTTLNLDLKSNATESTCSWP